MPVRRGTRPGPRLRRRRAAWPLAPRRRRRRPDPPGAIPGAGLPRRLHGLDPLGRVRPGRLLVVRRAERRVAGSGAARQGCPPRDRDRLRRQQLGRGHGRRVPPALRLRRLRLLRRSRALAPGAHVVAARAPRRRACGDPGHRLPPQRPHGLDRSPRARGRPRHPPGARLRRLLRDAGDERPGQAHHTRGARGDLPRVLVGRQASVPVLRLTGMPQGVSPQELAARPGRAAAPRVPAGDRFRRHRRRRSPARVLRRRAPRTRGGSSGCPSVVRGASRGDTPAHRAAGRGWREHPAGDREPERSHPASDAQGLPRPRERPPPAVVQGSRRAGIVESHLWRARRDGRRLRADARPAAGPALSRSSRRLRPGTSRSLQRLRGPPRRLRPHRPGRADSVSLPLPLPRGVAQTRRLRVRVLVRERRRPVGEGDTGHRRGPELAVGGTTRRGAPGDGGRRLDDDPRHARRREGLPPDARRAGGGSLPRLRGHLPPVAARRAGGRRLPRRRRGGGGRRVSWTRSCATA